MLKKTIKKLLNKFGYDLVRNKENIPLDFYFQIYEKEKVIDKKFYNVGAGPWRHPAWTNIDFYSDHYSKNPIDISFDLTKNEKLPLDDQTAELFYSSHTIEHINNSNAMNLFLEIHRVLKPGGGVRITTPNIDLDYAAWLSNDRFYFYWCHIEPAWQIKEKEKFKEASIGQLFLHHFASHISEIHPAKTRKLSDSDLQQTFDENTYTEALDICISDCTLELQRKYPGNHINWWNAHKLKTMLLDAGFKEVSVSAYGQSKFAVLRDIKYFDSTHPRLSLYVEATK